MSSKTIRILSLADISWSYINEGNAHIVLRIVGTPYVLRLMKGNDTTTDLKVILNTVDFVNYVTLPLFHKCEGIKYEVVQLTINDLSAITAQLLPVRPSYRKVKSLLCPYAILNQNLTIVCSSLEDNYCIEIKPKEGIFHANQNNQNRCYYCMKQYWKLQEGEINNISKYCPLDLFSGDKLRMAFSIRNLISNPQNNFKLFKNASIIYDNTSSIDFETAIQGIPGFNGSPELVIQLIVEILLNDSSSCITVDEAAPGLYSGYNREKCCAISSLKNNSILSRILKLQKFSDASYTSADDVNNDVFGYVGVILNNIKENNLNLYNDVDKELFIQHCDPLHLALLAAVARDCSIMITFTPNMLEGHIGKVIVNKTELSYRVAVTDIEPKPVTTLTKRMAMEEKLAKAYRPND